MWLLLLGWVSRARLDEIALHGLDRLSLHSEASTLPP